MNSLLSVDAALSQILTNFQQLGTEHIALEDAFGRILAQDLISTTALPPFANSSMDGFAVRAASTQSAPTRLRVIGDIPAGSSPRFAIQEGEAARIMKARMLSFRLRPLIRISDKLANTIYLRLLKSNRL